MSTKILFLIPRLDYQGTARQLQLLAAALPRSDFEPLVCTLAEDGPLAEPLRTAGVAVESLGWQRLVDPLPVMRLARLLRRFCPDVVHAWQFPALRLLWLAGGRNAVPVVFSPPLLGRVLPGALDRWLLRRAAAVVVQGVADVQHCRQLGVRAECVVQVAPGVAVGGTPPHAPLPQATQEALANGQRFVACMGRLEAHKGFRAAVWSFDIMQFLAADLQMLMIGAGPEWDELHSFARRINVADKIHWLGERPDGPSLLRLAQTVWVPDRTPGGVSVTLESLAVGVPVIASRWPILEEIVEDGVSGFLVPPGDKTAVVRKTRLLLDDAGLRSRMGQAARARAKLFAVDAMVTRYVKVYEQVTNEIDVPLSAVREPQAT